MAFLSVFRIGYSRRVGGAIGRSAMLLLVAFLSSFRNSLLLTFVLPTGSPSADIVMVSHLSNYFSMGVFAELGWEIRESTRPRKERSS